MKKHNTLKVVLIALLVFLVLSWIFPAAYFSSEFVEEGRVQMGLSDVFNYFMTTVSYFGHYALYLILVGAFYGVLYKIPAYRTFLDKIVAKVNSNVFIIVTVLLLALGVSFAGLQIGFAIFVPLIVAIILLMGYDKIVAALVVVGSMAAGLVGSTFAYGNNSIILSVLGLKADYSLLVRLIMLFLAVALLLFNIFMYIRHNKGNIKVEKPAKKVEAAKEEVVVAKKVEVPKKTDTKKAPAKKATEKKTAGKTITKKTTKAKSTRKNVNKAALRDEDIIVVKESVVNDSTDDAYLVPTRVEMTHKVWPFVVGFILLFVLLVMAWLTWNENGFGIAFFDNLTEKFTGFQLFKFPLFQKVYGTVNSFGNWTVIDLFLPVNLLLLILVIIYKVKFDDIIDGMVSGIKKALLPIVIVLLLYTILVLVTYHPYQLVIYKAILGLFKGFNIGTTLVSTLLAAILNVDPAYAYQALLPYLASTIDTSSYEFTAIIAQAMYGFSTIFAPTSLILMATLAYLKVSYKDWLKTAWKYLLELFVVLLIVFIVLALI
ncbi:MAG: hypothetical protein IKQ06_00890 [Bacilli bacterium]|nr:hypothetical protein [Bacilli bacterium]